MLRLRESSEPACDNAPNDRGGIGYPSAADALQAWLTVRTCIGIKDQGTENRRIPDGTASKGDGGLGRGTELSIPTLRKALLRPMLRLPCINQCLMQALRRVCRLSELEQLAAGRGRSGLSNVA